MKIKGADGHEYNVTGQGQGTFNSVGAGAGIASFLGFNAGNLFGWGNGYGRNGYNSCGCGDGGMSTPVSRYELGMMNEIASKDAKIGLLESNIYTDQKIADVYERLNNKINANKDAQDAINLQQAVYNGTNTATLNCMQGQIQQLYSLTKLIVPNSAICPGWGNVTVSPETTPAG